MRNSVLLKWKEFGVPNAPSVQTVFEEAPYVGMEQIYSYLRNGHVDLVACERNYDKIAGKTVEGTHCLLSDGEYSWDSMLPYYVKHYYMRLPVEFEQKVLCHK